MKIAFADARLRDQCNQHKLLVRRQGARRAEVIRRRLDALAAAETLADLRNAAGRLHELRGDRARQLSFDLDGPYRLIFESADEPVPVRDDGRLEWAEVRAVRILEIADTHE